MVAIGFSYAYEQALTTSVCAQQAPIFSQYCRIRPLPGRDSNSVRWGSPRDGFATNDGPGQLPCPQPINVQTCLSSLTWRFLTCPA